MLLFFSRNLEKFNLLAQSLCDRLYLLIASVRLVKLMFIGICFIGTHTSAMKRSYSYDNFSNPNMTQRIVCSSPDEASDHSPDNCEKIEQTYKQEQFLYTKSNRRLFINGSELYVGTLLNGCLTFLKLFNPNSPDDERLLNDKSATLTLLCENQMIAFWNLARMMPQYHDVLCRYLNCLLEIFNSSNKNKLFTLTNKLMFYMYYHYDTEGSLAFIVKELDSLINKHFMENGNISQFTIRETHEGDNVFISIYSKFPISDRIKELKLSLKHLVVVLIVSDDSSKVEIHCNINQRGEGEKSILINILNSLKLKDNEGINCFIEGVEQLVKKNGELAMEMSYPIRCQCRQILGLPLRMNPVSDPN